MAKVSFIVPVYNAEECLGYCISSILNQTHRDLELILINDGSTDNSLKICENYAKLDSRVKIISIPNKGVGNARNTGIEAATGEYIQFVDSDDTILPCMTEELLKASNIYQKDLVICGYYVVALDGNKFLSKQEVSSGGLGKECVLDKELFIEKFPYILWHFSLLESPWNRIYSKRVFDDKNIRFPIDITLGEDFLMNMEYYQACNGVVFLDNKYYNYVQTNEQSLSKVYRVNMLDIQMKIIHNLINMLSLDSKKDEENIKLINNYVVSHVIICLENLFHPLCKFDENQKKAEIAKILNDKQIRESFQNMDYIDPQYSDIITCFKSCDVQSLYEFMLHPKCSQIVLEKKRSELNPGIFNIILVAFLNLLLRLKKVKKIEIVKSSLQQKGIKITLKKVFYKV